MTKYVKTNINYSMKFKLTETGRKIWETSISAPYHKPDDEGFITLQIHEVMNLFGTHIVMGLEPPFETNIMVATSG